jgi:hypothetical protein
VNSIETPGYRHNTDCSALRVSTQLEVTAISAKTAFVRVAHVKIAGINKTGLEARRPETLEKFGIIFSPLI